MDKSSWSISSKGSTAMTAMTDIGISSPLFGLLQYIPLWSLMAPYEDGYEALIPTTRVRTLQNEWRYLRMLGIEETKWCTPEYYAWFNVGGHRVLPSVLGCDEVVDISLDDWVRLEILPRMDLKIPMFRKTVPGSVNHMIPKIEGDPESPGKEEDPIEEDPEVDPIEEDAEKDTEEDPVEENPIEENPEEDPVKENPIEEDPEEDPTEGNPIEEDPRKTLAYTTPMTGEQWRRVQARNPKIFQHRIPKVSRRPSQNLGQRDLARKGAGKWVTLRSPQKMISLSIWSTTLDSTMIC
ncbi:hypothetical protein HAX54_039292 [Datura stramonium]|uniref:Uncharacterized protein n=1 Tax=Datura stramonium TaxID=4076 RepID=A0ABS8VL41_DATST|nr:hypothetical protein [Datura stramonium]